MYKICIRGQRVYTPPPSTERSYKMNTKTNTKKNTKTNATITKKEEPTMTKKTAKTEPKTETKKTAKPAEPKTDFRAIVEKMVTDAHLASKYLEKLNRTCVLTESGRMIFLVEYKRSGVSVRSKMDAIPAAYLADAETVKGKPTAPYRVGATGEDATKALVGAYIAQMPKTLTARELAKAAADAEKAKAQAEKKAKAAEKKAKADAKSEKKDEPATAAK